MKLGVRIRDQIPTQLHGDFLCGPPLRGKQDDRYLHGHASTPNLQIYSAFRQAP